jgi:hypothetical protein
MGARSEQKALAVIDEIRKETHAADIHYLQLDLADFSSVINAAKDLSRCVPPQIPNCSGAHPLPQQDILPPRIDQQRRHNGSTVRKNSGWV